MRMLIYVILYRLCIVNEHNAMINLKNDMVKKHPKTERLKKNSSDFELEKVGSLHSKLPNPTLLVLATC